MEEQAEDSVYDADYVIEPKQEMLDDTEKHLTPSTEELSNSSQHILDWTDLDQQTVKFKPMKTETILCRDIAELHKAHQSSKDREECDTDVSTGYSRTQSKQEPSETVADLPQNSAQKLGVPSSSKCTMSKYKSGHQTSENCTNRNTASTLNTVDQSSHGNYDHKINVKSTKHMIQGESCVNSSTSTFTLPVESGETFFLVPDNATTEKSTVSNADTNILKLILQNQSVLCGISNSILENQKKIMHKLANLSAQMEEYSKNTDQYNVKYLKEFSGSVENTSSNIKQIENIQDLEFMEMTLSDNEQKIKMKNALKFLCSGGEGTAKNCAFRLVDIIFSRDFLCKCSWSGSSRSDGVKISLKCFKKTLNFFYEIIKLWDDSYTLEQNEKFFKDILKNSNKRFNAKFERISTKRYRNKIDKSHKKQKTFDVMIKDNGLESILANNVKEPRNFHDNSETTNNDAKKTNESGDYENEDDQTEDEESLC